MEGDGIDPVDEKGKPQDDAMRLRRNQYQERD